ncbi:DUF4232 domain-containing protein [Sphingomonas sp. CARO-RG-8B-R24-01]|uniref:DUF4232 domain-containing protein n=1 Tax=Sphingomonas sp. CARO-RG-8B-R24-01 TaxID=2914831 RepID=UPI001F56EA65|nr:DUF4232 domain-containing protein [Sphingomonas sp. CARO-RG-8B-R24-01]
MILFALLVTSTAAQAPAPMPPPCRAAQLRLSLDGKDGDFNGMSHSGVELSLRNHGPECTLQALPTIAFFDARGRVLPATRRAPVGMHPGPAMLPVRISGGHRAATALRWVSGPVFPTNRALRAASVTVRIGNTSLRSPITALLYGAADQPAGFDQPPLRTMEGMAAG